VLARLVYSLCWLNKAEPPDFHLSLVQDRPEQWVNIANLKRRCCIGHYSSDITGPGINHFFPPAGACS
jgi:hypothetical protein